MTRRITRAALVALTAGAAVTALAAPGLAAPPNKGCQHGFTLSPASVVPAGASGQVDNVNHDGLICIKQITNGSGSFTIFTDNVAP